MREGRAAPNPLFPAGQRGEHGQQLGLRLDNSWTARLEDVDVRELLEGQPVNTTAPFLLCLLRRTGSALPST
ncbi:hypothetical protein [Deinococcus hopiensis]|uniref:hypothetical protein n=1 Tax=Deinococcus hopiensis TaxID=309885 RepID=UPI000A05231B|nr:hypothetical protein [Deinococcus hopiensis]